MLACRLSQHSRYPNSSPLPTTKSIASAAAWAYLSRRAFSRRFPAPHARLCTKFPPAPPPTSPPDILGPFSPPHPPAVEGHHKRLLRRCTSAAVFRNSHPSLPLPSPFFSS